MKQGLFTMKEIPGPVLMDVINVGALMETLLLPERVVIQVNKTFSFIKIKLPQPQLD